MDAEAELNVDISGCINLNLLKIVFLFFCLVSSFLAGSIFAFIIVCCVWCFFYSKKVSLKHDRLYASFFLTLLFLAGGVIAFGIVVSIWDYPKSPPYWLELSTYLSFMWSFVLLMKLLPHPECDGSYDYDLCGANDWAYILFIPVVLIVHTTFFYWLLTYIDNHRSHQN